MADGQKLREFVTWWQRYCKGDEKGEAQVFLDRLLRAFGHEGALEAGGRYEQRITRKHEGKTSTAFADYLLPNRVLIEMKKRGENLNKHYDQAFRYWLGLTPNKPKYVILCNFDEFWIYELDYQLDEPRDRVKIDELPERWGPLAFLFNSVRPPQPSFRVDLIAVTQKAAAALANVYRNLIAQRDLPQAHARRFVFQCMMALFAEDIGLLERYQFTNLIEECLSKEDASSYDLFFLLFSAMNRTRAQLRRKPIPYFDGGLFAEIHPIELSKLELTLLRQAAEENWSQIRPAIFGTLFEKSANPEDRHLHGEHFTSETEIQYIVQPVIVRPWLEQIEAANSPADLLQLQARLSQYQVLDPACGSGNFLYVAYREMKRLEARLLERLREMSGVEQTAMSFVSARQFHGFDIDPFAVELAKVSLMIGKKLAIDAFHLAEKPLPLDNVDQQIRTEDALFADWGDFDAVIGNPPYLGAKLLKQDRANSEYVNRIRAAFPDVPGNADYCVYWFRKAHDLMKPGARAGLVGTNTIRQNYSRIGGLDHIVATGGTIFEAISSVPWAGDAKVHVSIACWSKGEAPFKPPRLGKFTGKLDGVNQIEYALVDKIGSSLSAKTDVSEAARLAVNITPKRVFQGQTPGHMGFILERHEAADLIKQAAINQQVIFPYLTGDDLLGKPRAAPNRYIIDFGERDINEARAFRAAFQRLEQRVLPDRRAKADAERQANERLLAHNPKAAVNHHHAGALTHWWRHFYPRVDRREAMQFLGRYIVCSRVTKRPIFDFVHPHICPGDSLQTFAFEDDYTFGILQSNAHAEWFKEKGSSLKADPRYTPQSVYDTFPFPQQPAAAAVKAVAEAGRALHEYRRSFLNRFERMTLRDLYQGTELPGKNELKDRHAALDAAVLAVYGFSKQDDVLARLLELNLSVQERTQRGVVVTAPGIPPDYPTPSELVSAGCIPVPDLI